jgi:hypothetical protein
VMLSTIKCVFLATSVPGAAFSIGSALDCWDEWMVPAFSCPCCCLCSL